MNGPSPREGWRRTQKGGVLPVAGPQGPLAESKVLLEPQATPMGLPIPHRARGVRGDRHPHSAPSGLRSP
jgi:hypothetical protein